MNRKKMEMDYFGGGQGCRLRAYNVDTGPGSN